MYPYSVIRMIQCPAPLGRRCQSVAGPIGQIAPGRVDDALLPSVPVASCLRELPPSTSTVGQNA